MGDMEPRPSYRILIVEDENLLRETYQLILSSEPYGLDVAVNGQEAMDCCRQNRYHLILLDIMMPVMNGVEFLEWYKGQPFDHAKVVVFSNLSPDDEVGRALALGANKAILKSDLSPRQLLAMIKYELDAS